MQKKQTEAEAEINREKLNVDMYSLNSRVNDLYFGILMLDEQLAQNALLQNELGRNFRQITAYVENGANQADLDAVKVEQLNTRQKKSRVDIFAHCNIGGVIVPDIANSRRIC